MPTVLPAARPPSSEVSDLWNKALPVTDDPEVSAWLASRALAPDKVELFDLARAIPAGTTLPRWASCKGISWTAHHRLIFQGIGPTGQPESIHARAICEVPYGVPKGLWPASGPGSAKGLVMADPLGRLLLEGDASSWWTRRVVIIAEGVPDFLTWATNFSDADSDAPAVFGITAGSWNEDLAKRVPLDAMVIVAAHHDEAGDGYASKISATLQGHEVRRW
jgi:hypothetical protein